MHVSCLLLGEGTSILNSACTSLQETLHHYAAANSGFTMRRQNFEVLENRCKMEFRGLCNAR